MIWVFLDVMKDGEYATDNRKRNNMLAIAMALESVTFYQIMTIKSAKDDVQTLIYPVIVRIFREKNDYIINFKTLWVEVIDIFEKFVEYTNDILVFDNEIDCEVVSNFCRNYELRNN